MTSECTAILLYAAYLQTLTHAQIHALACMWIMNRDTYPHSGMVSINKNITKRYKHFKKL